MAERRVRVLEESGNRLRLLIEGFSLPLVNGVRRACYTDVPVMAADYVEIFDNNTVLYDEIIAHRIGLIPLTSEAALEKYRWPEECKDADISDSSCYAVLRLEVETGPGEDARMATSGDLEPLDPDVRPVYDGIPIVLMSSEQRLRLQVYARLGYGKEHAKWMPVSVAAHKYVPVLEFDLDGVSEECLSCIEAGYPWLVEKMREMRRGRIDVLEDVNTSGLYWCIRKKCEGSSISLNYDSSRFILTVEGTGALPPRRIVLEAARAVARKAENLLARVEELRGSTS